MVLQDKRRDTIDSPTAPATTYEMGHDEDASFASAMAREASRHIDRGRTKEAEKCLRLGLQRCPNHPECLSFLAVCVAVGDKKFVTAERLAKQVVQEHPDDARALYALGRVNLEGSRRRTAFRHFERSRTLGSSDPVLAEDLDRMEPRRTPVLRFLHRNHFLNRVLGRIRARLAPRRRRP